MTKRLTFILLACLTISCGREKPEPATTPKPAPLPLEYFTDQFEVFDVAEKCDVNRLKQMLDRNPELVKATNWVPFENHRDRGYSSGTPLHYAARGGCIKAVYLLLERGAYIDAGSMGNGSPLVWAIINNKSETAYFLLEKGASVDMPPDFVYYATWSSPLARAILDNGDYDLIEEMLWRGADPDGGDVMYCYLVDAVKAGRADIVRLLISYGADVNSYYRSGRLRPLEAAIRKSDSNLVRLLIEAGAETKDNGLYSNAPFSAIATAAEEGNLEMVDYFLSLTESRKIK